MAQLVIPQGVLVRLIWNKGGEASAVNVLGALNPGAVAINQSLANTVGAAIKARFTSSGYVGVISNQYALAQVTLRNINVANQAEFPDAGAAVVGTDTSHPLPPQTALVVTLRTAMAGPSYRGRVYMCGWGEGANDTTGLAVAGSAAGATAFVAGVQTDLAAAGLTLAVLSRPRDADPLHIPPILAKAGWGTAVTSIILRNLVWDTQRRRSVPGI